MTPFPIIQKSNNQCHSLTFHNPEDWLSDPSTTKEADLQYLAFCRAWIWGSALREMKSKEDPGECLLELLKVFAKIRPYSIVSTFPVEDGRVLKEKCSQMIRIT